MKGFIIWTKQHRNSTCVVDYPSGKLGILLDPRDANLARQHPGDYLFGLEKAVRGALEQASKEPAFSANEVIGIGVDTTGSSPLPIDERNVPLGLHEKWNSAAVLVGPEKGRLCQFPFRTAGDDLA